MKWSKIIISLQEVKENVFKYCPREYIEGGYYYPFPGITAGIIRMWVLFKGGPYMRKYGISTILATEDKFRLDDLFIDLVDNLSSWFLFCQKNQLCWKGFEIFSSNWKFRTKPLLFFDMIKPRKKEHLLSE